MENCTYYENVQKSTFEDVRLAHSLQRLGTPKDFWPVAVIALVTTLSVAGMSMYQIKEDSSRWH